MPSRQPGETSPRRSRIVPIHPAAIVDPSAQLGAEVSIGPFCVIEAGAVIGDRCILESHVVVKRQTVLGNDNRIFEAAILGGLPQHAHMPTDVGGLVVGSGNILREHVTLHRALHPGEVTIVGDHNLLMAGAHVAHDCRVGNHTIFANNALLAGHVQVEDRAYLSGGVAIHQYCRIGGLAMVAGLARVVKDVPPFVTIDGNSGYVVGLNSIGLKRAGYTISQISELKAAYRTIYRRGLTWSTVLSTLAKEFPAGPAAHFLEFLQGTVRGIVAERRLPPGSTLKLTEEAPEEAPLRAKAG
jgi:UDP-N-acetylglucosamine acyltransferase